MLLCVASAAAAELFRGCSILLLVGVDILQRRPCLITGVIERRQADWGYFEHRVRELE